MRRLHLRSGAMMGKGEAGSRKAKLSPLFLHSGLAVPTEATAGPSGSLPLCRRGWGGGWKVL